MYLEIKTVTKFEEIDYNNFKEPVLISEGCLSMPAVKKWSKDYLEAGFKNTPVYVEVYKNKELMGRNTSYAKKKKIPFNEFINYIFTEKSPFYYFAQQPIKNCLKYDIKCDFDKLRQSIEQYIFIGYHSLSGCHIHVSHDFILNQITGTKTVYMFDYNDNPTLKMNPFISSIFNFIKDNFFKLDHDKYKIYKVVLKPGNSLLIPPWWFHAVQGNEFSCSITKVYKRTNINYLKKDKYLHFLYYRMNIKKYILYFLIFLLVVLLINIYIT